MTKNYEYTFKKVRCIVEQYWNIKKAVNEYRMQKKSHTTEQGPRPQGVVSDPTRREAEINLSEVPFVVVKGRTIRKPEAWIDCIDDVMKKISFTDYVIFKAMWEEKKKDEIEECAHMSIGAYYKRRHEIISIIAVKAAERGLIKMDERW